MAEVVGPRQKKAAYLARAVNLLETNKRILLVNADNVGSKQFADVRRLLRGRATVLMGKNTLIRKAVRQVGEKNAKLLELNDYIYGNCGLVLTNEDMRTIRDLVESVKKGAAAKPGSISNVDIVVPKGPTGMDPQQTAFLQAMNIQTKIVKMQIEIVNDVPLIKKGDKVGASEAVLLQKLKIFPYQYCLQTENCYDDGDIFPADMLDITDDEILRRFSAGVSNVAALSLAINFPTLASVPHSIVNGYKNVMSVAIEAGYSIPNTVAEDYQKFLKDPNAFAAAAAPAAAAPAPAAAAPAPAAKAPAPAPEPEDDIDLGGLF